LYALGQGLRASLLPAINLSQISEFSLVLLQVGVLAGQVTPKVASAASLAFVLLAVTSTFMMTQSDPLTRRAVAALKRAGLRDLDQDAPAPGGAMERDSERPIMLLGFYRVASSLLGEI